MSSRLDEGFLSFVQNNYKVPRVMPGNVDNRAFQGRFGTISAVLQDATAITFYQKIYWLIFGQNRGVRQTRRRALEAKTVAHKGRFKRVRLFVTPRDGQQGKLKNNILDVSVNLKTGAVIATPEIREAIFQFGSLVLVTLRPGRKKNSTEHVLFRVPGTKKEKDHFYLSNHTTEHLFWALSPVQANPPEKVKQVVSRDSVEGTQQTPPKKRRRVQSTIKDTRMQALLLAAGI